MKGNNSMLFNGVTYEKCNVKVFFVCPECHEVTSVPLSDVCMVGVPLCKDCDIEMAFESEIVVES